MFAVLIYHSTGFHKFRICPGNQGLVSESRKSCYRKISRRSTATLWRCLPNLKAIWKPKPRSPLTYLEIIRKGLLHIKTVDNTILRYRLYQNTNNSYFVLYDKLTYFSRHAKMTEVIIPAWWLLKNYTISKLITFPRIQKFYQPKNVNNDYFLSTGFKWI